MFSSAPMRPRSALLVFGIGLGQSGLWMLFPELLRPKPVGLPFDRNGTEAAASGRTRAVLAGEIGAISGDLWAAAAFTGARFMGTDRSTSLDRTNSGQLAQAAATAETALALAPVNGAAWLFLARLPASSQDGENRVGTLLEMSYCTAPSALDLAPWRLEARQPQARSRRRTSRRSPRTIFARFWIAGQNFNKRSWPPIATPGRGTSLFSSLLWPMPIRPWPNCFAPASQNESGWPIAATSRKTGIKFACPSSAAGLDV
jgi:hypothetical protein